MENLSQIDKTEELKVGKEKSVINLLFLTFFLLLLTSISSYSLWIDEGITLWISSQPNLAEMFRKMIDSPGAIPFYAGHELYIRLWTSLFGLSEYGARFSNVPFILLTLALATRLPVSFTFRSSIILLTSLSPFLWFYMNEIRYYIPLFSASVISLMGLIFYYKGNEKWKARGPCIILSGFLLGLFINISMVFSLPSLFLTGALLCKREKDKPSGFFQDWKKPVILSAPFFILIGSYYLWIILGAGASGGRMPQLDGGLMIERIAFVFYEFLGLAGLGPPRNILRSHIHPDTFVPYLPYLIPALLFILIFIIYAFFLFRKEIVSLLTKNHYLWGFLFGFFIFYGFALVTKFNFFGRRIIFLYPYFLFSLAFTAEQLLSRKEFVGFTMALSVGFLVIWGLSDARLRLLHKYFKDNYKSAVQEVIKIKDANVPVYWVADSDTAAYYGIHFSNIGIDYAKIARDDWWRPIGSAIYAAGWTVDEIRDKMKSQNKAILVFSKPDLFDIKKGWSTFISEAKPFLIAELNAIKIFQIINTDGTKGVNSETMWETYPPVIRFYSKL